MSCFCLLQAIFLFFLIKYKPLKYNNVYTYPDWGYGIGWFMAMSSMVCIPLGIIWMIWKTPGTFSEVKIHTSLRLILQYFTGGHLIKECHTVFSSLFTVLTVQVVCSCHIACGFIYFVNVK